MASVANVQAGPNTADSSGLQRWSIEAVVTLLEQPLNDLLFRAQTTHRSNFDPNEVQLSTLLNIKTGGCPEDCAYCPQSARYDTGVESEALLDVELFAALRKSLKPTALPDSVWALHGAHRKTVTSTK